MAQIQQSTGIIFDFVKIMNLLPFNKLRFKRPPCCISTPIFHACISAIHGSSISWLISSLRWLQSKMKCVTELPNLLPMKILAIDLPDF